MTPQTSDFWSKVDGALHSLLLIGAIVLLLYVEVLERLILHKPQLEEYERAYTLILLILLSLAIATERFVRFRRINTQFEQIARGIENALPARLLKDKEVGIEALRLIHAAERTIKVLIYEEEASQSETISEEIAKHMARHKNVRFEMVLVANLSKVDDEFWKIHEDRFREYRDRGLGSSDFKRYILDSKSPVGLDLLIVDDDHLGIAFSRLPRPRPQTKELGIRF